MITATKSARYSIRKNRATAGIYAIDAFCNSLRKSLFFFYLRVGAEGFYKFDAVEAVGFCLVAFTTGGDDLTIVGPQTPVELTVLALENLKLSHDDLLVDDGGSIAYTGQVFGQPLTPARG